MKKVECPRCNGEGEIFSGYYGHPETSKGRPMMYECSLCKGEKEVREVVALKYLNDKTPDFF